MPNIERPIYSCMTKATDQEAGNPQYSHNWVVARRAQFEIFSDRIECGDWQIPFSSILQATAFETKQWFIPIVVLQIATADRTFQFGFNPWADPVSRLPVDVKKEKVRLKYSTYSLAVRLVLVAAFIWYVLKR